MDAKLEFNLIKKESAMKSFHIINLRELIKSVDFFCVWD